MQQKEQQQHEHQQWLESATFSSQHHHHRNRWSNRVESSATLLTHTHTRKHCTAPHCTTYINEQQLFATTTTIHQINSATQSIDAAARELHAFNVFVFFVVVVVLLCVVPVRLNFLKKKIHKFGFAFSRRLVCVCHFLFFFS